MFMLRLAIKFNLFLFFQYMNIMIITLYLARGMMRMHIPSNYANNYSNSLEEHITHIIKD